VKGDAQVTNHQDNINLRDVGERPKEGKTLNGKKEKKRSSAG